MTLISLANAYGDIGQPQKGIQIFDMLLLCLDEKYMDGESVSRLQMLIKRNYIKFLEWSGRYHEALDIARMLLKSVIKNNYGRMISVLLSEVSWNMQKICIDNGETIEDILPDIKKMLRQAYYIAAARDDEVNLRIIKTYYYGCFEEEV